MLFDYCNKGFKIIRPIDWVNDKDIYLKFKYPYQESVFCQVDADTMRFIDISDGCYYSSHQLLEEAKSRSVKPVDLPLILSYFKEEKESFFEMLSETDIFLILGTVIKYKGVDCYPWVNGSMGCTKNLNVYATPIDNCFNTRFSVLCI